MSWIIPVAGILNFLLGLIVWLRKPKDPFYYGFFIFVLSTVLSISVDFIFRFQPSIFVLQTAYATAAFIPLTLLLWVLELCGTRTKEISFERKLLVFVPTGLIFMLAYVPDLFVVEIERLTVLGYQGKLGPLFSVYSLYYVAYIGVIFYLLYKRYKTSDDSSQKSQIRYVVTGILLYSISAVTFSLILPTYFKIFDFTLLDAPSLLFFVILTTYAILKLHLFNVKVIATELLVFTLWIILSVQLFTSEGRERVITSLVLFTLVLVGMSLIRSVIKEVNQRERIETLAKNLKDANQKLARANERLTELDQLKSEFVSLATHQIRGPLAAMKGYASLILEGDFGPITDEVRSAVQTIFTSSKSLAAIVEDFLNISRIELGRMKYEFNTVNLSNMITELINELKPNVENRGLQLEVAIDEGIMVVADAVKIKQVFANLIDNAIKYTPKGVVGISLSCGNGKALFAVKDSGIGISEETMPALFQKFSRAKDASKTNIAGTGLGLYVAKEMVKAHHGRIWAESKGEGEGSTFYVELDCKN